MKNYTVGVDFGTLSARAAVVSLTGELLGSCSADYPHGVMNGAPGQPSQGPAWALQHPEDYLQVLRRIVPEALRQAGVSPEQAAGLALDMTSCTVLPVTADGTPLCRLERFRDEPHAYVKLWKHHAAQSQAGRMTRLARERQEPWLPDYGGIISSEWLFPKLAQILEEAPEVYAAADLFLEAGDWLVWQLTGALRRGRCGAGYKAFCTENEYPRDFLRAFDPRLEAGLSRLDGQLLPQDGRAGELTAQGAALTGLPIGTPVAAAHVDAHVSAAAAGVCTSGRMVMIMGTSACHMLLHEEKIPVPGICGVVKDGILPGFYGYEAGQPAVGDCFQWFLENALPGSYEEEAKRRKIGLHALLREKAARLLPGESGLLALDWWNGNRSVLNDAGLSGMLMGLTLHTRPEEIYRALLEATAFGTRKIIESFRQSGVPVDSLTALGGIPGKDPLAMQICADVLGMPVEVPESTLSPAFGSAIFAAAAAGVYPSMTAAIDAMSHPHPVIYRPDPASAAVYDQMYEEYSALHDYFGRSSAAMKRLKELAARQRSQQRGESTSC